MGARRQARWLLWAVAGAAVVLGTRAGIERARRPGAATTPQSAVASGTSSRPPHPRNSAASTSGKADPFYDVFDGASGSGPKASPTTAPAAPGKLLAPDQLFATSSPAVGTVELKDRALRAMTHGSGFFVSADGLLVTNFHVIAGASAASVRSGEGRAFVVEGFVAADPDADLALLKVSAAKPVPFLKVAEVPAPPIGTRVFAIGNPHGMTNTLSDGLVSGMRAFRPKSGITVIQTSAAIGGGSSGGPLMTADGLVIGVTTSQLRDAQNVNFAVPAERVRALIAARGPVLPLAAAAAAGSSTAAGRRSASPLDRVASLVQQGAYAEAMIVLRDVGDDYQKDARYWVLLGRVQNEGFRSYAVAEDAFRRAIQLKPDYVRAHEGLGLLLSERGRQHEAVGCFLTVAKLRPTSSAPYRSAGVAAARMDNHAEALAFFDRGLKLAPDDADLHLERAASLAHLARDPEALAAYRVVLKADPKSCTALNGVADINLRAGRIDDAKTGFTAVVRLYPNHPHAHLQLGHIARRQGDAASARASWSKGATLDPKDPDTREARRLLALLEMREDDGGRIVIKGGR